MSSTQRMYDATGTPIAWVAEWAGPHEGGMTLAMKYAWANALDGASASKSICGKSLVQNYSHRLHGRSFLVPGWARVARLDAQPSIGSLIARRDMSRYAGRWSQWLASDAYFRYCPECIQLGYQSLLYQVDALTCCPLHRAALLSACRRCAAPTPRYALTAETMANPFCCPVCGAAYGERFDPRDWKCAGLHAQAAGALLPLVRFMRRAERWNIDWLHWDEWFGPWLGEVEQREKRIATFDVLRRTVTHNLDEGIFRPPARPLAVSRGRVVVAPVASRFDSPAEPRDHRQIYKAIRRHLLKRLPSHVDRRLLLNPQSDEINVTNEMLRLSLKKCPFLQTAWLWRLRFERPEAMVSFHRSQYKTLTLREDALNWPWQGAGDEAVWAHYVLTGFHAAAEIVFEWWGRAAALAASPVADHGHARSMELHVEFANLLSPSRLPVPPRMAAVFGPRRPRQSVMALYVVGPKAGFEKLLACCKCASSEAQAADGEVPVAVVGDAPGAKDHFAEIR